MKFSLRIATISLMLAGALALVAPAAHTSALLVDLETSHVHLAGSTEVVVPDRGVTRTHGYWLSHPVLTGHVLTEHLDSALDCGWAELTSTADVLGVLAADPTWDSNGVMRTKLARARVLCARQLVAAILSGALPNAAPVPVDTVTGLDLITAGRTALSSLDAKECIRISELLAAYLEAHCDAEITLDCGYIIEPKQTARGRFLANTAIMDFVAASTNTAQPSVPKTDSIGAEPTEPSTDATCTPEPTVLPEEVAPVTPPPAAPVEPESPAPTASSTQTPTAE